MNLWRRLSHKRRHKRREELPICGASSQEHALGQALLLCSAGLTLSRDKNRPRDTHGQRRNRPRLAGFMYRNGPTVLESGSENMN
ncbi:unnamed protein product [Microthlaspi erraticum]|uniref:Uncharacterized protein n=1 Tax=Microthlaspi erraticum TaxID=1685480 RepID=A0A6D2J665_9BRAS|nr:unnamed protein product [Microthlaspi erraticum]